MPGSATLGSVTNVLSHYILIKTFLLQVLEIKTAEYHSLYVINELKYLIQRYLSASNLQTLCSARSAARARDAPTLGGRHWCPLHFDVKANFNQRNILHYYHQLLLPEARESKARAAEPIHRGLEPHHCPFLSR